MFRFSIKAMLLFTTAVAAYIVMVRHSQTPSRAGYVACALFGSVVIYWAAREEARDEEMTSEEKSGEKRPE